MPALAVIVIDQITKLLVHSYMEYGSVGQIKLIGDWFKLYYTLNPGMAFGITLGASYGKLILSLFRLVAVSGIAYYLWYAAKNNAPKGFLWCISLILGGALGNVIDSTFYGVFLDNAPEGSPSAWFHGQVIDMIYLDIWEGIIPEFLPSWWPSILPSFGSGQYMSFWPIFNVADSSIFIGVATILIFQNSYFNSQLNGNNKE